MTNDTPDASATSAMIAVLQARTPPPRQLGAKETLDTLTHWKTTFSTFYKRDGAFKHFMRSDYTWDPQATNYGQVDEGDVGLKRKAIYMKEDRKGFFEG